MPSAPTIDVLVLNYNGRDHLAACLPSLAAQRTPGVRIVVVDNGSTDDSLAFVRATHPAVAVHEIGRNAGFAGGYNEAVRASTAAWVAILNNDTHVAADWLDQLLAAAARHGATVVASRILDWEGAHVDFDGGLTSIEGHSWQAHHGAPASTPVAERPLLFACAGSMLIRRDAFLHAGGFDEDYFAYFEDVDLGWRLTAFGYRTVFAPAAITYHRVHGTSGGFAQAQRLRLYERNALATIYKNYEDDTLRRVLPVAVALSLARGLAAARLDPEAFVLGRGRPPAVTGLPARAAAQLLALEDFGRWLPALAGKRAAVQARRTRPDLELFALFGEPFRRHVIGPEYDAAARALLADFGLDDLVSGRGTTAVAAAVRPAAPRIEVGGEWPSISIVIPTIVGHRHLPECFAALRAQHYPAERIETLVVDNGAPRDLGPLVTREAPHGRVLAPGRNLGFAAANNLGVREARGQYVAFLNDDTRPDPQWLSSMADVARRRRVACVASYVVSWDGLLVDFAGGQVNFEGKGYQSLVNATVADVALEEQPVLFANGAAMMVHRDALVDAGGWDEDTFAYYEDTELGWRLWMLGHEVWFSPAAVVRHKHNGTSGRWPEPPKVRLLERNALRTIYALLETDHLARALPAALLLAMDRALLQTGLHRGAGDGGTATLPTLGAPPGLAGRGRYALRARGARKDLPLAANLRRIGPRGLLGALRDTLLPSLTPTPAPATRRAYFIEAGRVGPALDGRMEVLPADGAARLLGLADFLRELPALSARRSALQGRRQRRDHDILSRFGGRWLDPVPAAHQALHSELQATLVRVFGPETALGDR